MSTVSFGNAQAGRRHRTMRWPRFAVLALIGALLAALGAAALKSVPWETARLHQAVRSWPVAQAKVLSVSIAEQRAPGPNGGIVSELVLTASYEFDVAGETRFGNRAGLSDRAAPHDRDLKTLYRKLDFARITGRSVPVRYDPGDPGHAYLDTSFAWREAVLLAVLGLTLLVLSFTSFAMACRGRGPTARR